jgi:hypothetical protein
MTLLSTTVSVPLRVLHHTQMEYIILKAKFTTFTETYGLLSIFINILHMKEDYSAMKHEK